MAVTLTTTYQLISQDYVGDAFGAVYVRCYAKYNRQEVANNRTEISVQTRLHSAGTWYAQNGNEWYTGASGLTTASGTAPTNYSPGEVTLGTLTGWITHNNDGTKTIDVSSGFVSTPWGFAKTTTGNVTLPAIPRASKINSITNSISNDGNTVKVNVNFTKYASSFYQQLVLMNVGRTETIATFNGVSSGTDYYLDATARQKLYNWIGTSLDNKGVICDLKTYSSSAMTTLIGTYSDVTYFKLPTYSLSFTTSNVVDSVTTYDTYKPTTSTFIANLSKPTYTFSASSSTGSTYGRSIGYSIGSTSVTSPYTNNNYTGQSLTITASDGRRSATSTPSMTHVAYFKPTLTTKVKRPTPTGSTADVTVNGTYYDGTGLTNLETPLLTFKYTERGGSEQTITIPLTTTTSGNVVSFTGTAQLTGLDYKKTVSWGSIISDILNITTTNTGTLVEGLPLWNGYKRNDTNYFNINGNLTADSLYGRPYDFDTNNTTDTWVPVAGGGKWQHRVIPSVYNSVTPGIKLESIDGRITNANIAHTYENNKVHMQLLHSSGSMTSNKPISDGYILHCSWDNSSPYEGQLFIPNNDGVQLQFRGCNNGTWAVWRNIFTARIVYDNASGNNGTVTITETAANFKYMDIIFFNTIANEYQTLTLSSPNGKAVRLNHFDNENNSTVRVFHTKYTISGTSITKGANYYSYIVSGGVGSVTNTNYFKIVQVIGWK